MNIIPSALAGKVMIRTQEERENVLAEIIREFKADCWMFNHKSAAKTEAYEDFKITKNPPHY